MARVATTPVVMSSCLILLLLQSATNSVAPSLLSASPLGQPSSAAAPAPSASPSSPLSARVVTVPVAMSSYLILLLLPSATNSVAPSTLSASASGPSNSAAAPAPSASPSSPLPARVVAVPGEENPVGSLERRPYTAQYSEGLESVVQTVHYCAYGRTRSRLAFGQTRCGGPPWAG